MEIASKIACVNGPLGNMPAVVQDIRGYLSLNLVLQSHQRGGTWTVGQLGSPELREQRVPILIEDLEGEMRATD